MNYDCGSDRQLSIGALQFLSSFEISEKKRNIYVNFILQIYNCVPLLHSEYFSCSLFDKENICNTFILKYNKSEGRPYPGDIISVTKINVSILSDGEHRLYTCEETKLLEKNKKFLINPKKLKSISSKQKLVNKDIIKNSSKKNKLKEIQEKELSEEDIDYFSKENNVLNDEISDYDYNNINDNITNINNVININGGEISTEKKSKKSKKFNSNEKTIKIHPQKKEDSSQKDKEKENKLILESNNPFLDEFQEGIILSENSNNNLNINNNQEESLDYSLLSNRTKNKENSIKENSTKNHSKLNPIKNAQFKYISEIKQILLGFQNMPVNFCFKIKCRVDKFDIGNKNTYSICCKCSKKIEKDKICCKRADKRILYSFFVRVRDPSGICNVYFDDIGGNDFMGITAEKYNFLLADQTPIGRIVFSEYKIDFFENEFMIWLEFPEDTKNKSKIYKAVKVERIKKVHRYEMIRELKNILV